MQLLARGLKIKIYSFIIIRYFIYVVQFGNSLFIAKKLGPFFMGEYGFVLLIIQYLTQINFGIPYALNVKLATFEGKNNQQQSDYVTNALLFTFVHSVFLLLLAITTSYISIPIFYKYDFYAYLFIVVFISIFQNLDVLFINIFRIKNSLKAITFYQATMPVTNFIACIFWSGKELLTALLLLQTICYILSFIIFVYYSPVKFRFNIKINIQGDLLKSGLALLLFNASFYLIMIVTRTFVSYYFSVKELGFFSFALSFAQASFLALDTLSFLIFPKFINRLKHNEGTILYKKMEYVRGNYSLISFIIIFLTILIFPVILFFLPAYASSFKPFALISISLAVLSGNFGISTLFISTGKEFLLSKIAFAAFMINLGLVWVIGSHSSTYFMLCLAPLITYITYSCLLGYYYKTVFLKNKTIEAFFSNFDWRLIMPALLLSIAILLNNLTIQVIAYLCIMLLNFKRFKELIPILKNIVNNPGIFKI